MIDMARNGRAAAASAVARRIRYRPWQPCQIGIEICRDPLRDYTTVRWKATLASAAIERWQPRWFHYIQDPTDEDHPRLVLVSLLFALLLAQIRY